MAGTALSKFADFIAATGPAYLTGPEVLVNEAVERNYLWGALASGPQGINIQSGTEIRDALMLDSSNTFEFYKPNATFSYRNPQVIDTISAPWRFAVDHMAFTDHEIEPILDAAHKAGARAASWLMLRLPHEVAPLVKDWLWEHVPGRAEKVMRRLREMHGGKEYDSRFGHRMRGQGVHARMIARRFEIAARRLGLDGELPPLDCAQFRVPLGTQDQPSLF